MPAIKTKSGRLTAYGFACGYVERSGPFTLSMEHGVYHVKGYGVNSRVCSSYRTLTQARRELRTIRNTDGLPENSHGNQAAIARYKQESF